MLIRVGYTIRYEAPEPTPMVTMLSIHPSRRKDIVGSETIVTARMSGDSVKGDLVLGARPPVRRDQVRPWLRGPIRETSVDA